MSIAEMLQQRSRNDTDRLAFAFEGDSITFGQLSGDAETLARTLYHDGIGRGDRVALVLPAGVNLVRLFYALQRIGAVPCIFDPSLPEATAQRRIASIRPKLILTSVPATNAGVQLAQLPDDPDAVAFLQQTSGTGGEPLAALVLQRNVVASLDSVRDLINPGPGDVLVGWVPPWHDLGLLRFIIAPVFFGIPCYLIPPAVSTIPQWLGTISAVKGTITGAPDFAWRLATRFVGPAMVDLRSLRWATNGGEPVRSSTIRTFEAHFGVPEVMCPGYGLAEATLGVTCAKPRAGFRIDDHGNVSCGTPMKNVEVRIEGEQVLVRGPNVFAGYFEAEEQTTSALRDGWLHTGDVGRIDEEGNLYILGRMRAMIKRGGATLAPRELEEAAQGVEGVRLAAAVGVPSELTEEIVVVVEAVGNEAAIESEVKDAVERAIGFAPDRVLVLPPRSIPRTANGKLRHAALRNQLTPSRFRNSPSVISDEFSRR